MDLLKEILVLTMLKVQLIENYGDPGERARRLDVDLFDFES